MKKMIMAIAVAALAVAANAATVNWKSGANIQGPEGGTLAKGSWTMYVWDDLTAADYASLDVSKIYGIYSTQTDSAKSATVGTPSLGATVKNTTAADDKDYFAVILLTYTDGNGKDWYIANAATAHTDALGNGATVTNLGKNLNGSGSALSWTQVSAVPEPTSGLLLLLGMAGLALKRKHA